MDKVISPWQVEALGEIEIAASLFKDDIYSQVLDPNYYYILLCLDFCSLITLLSPIV